MTARNVLTAIVEPPLFVLGWSFAPASKYTHITHVRASSSIEALEYLIDQLESQTGKEVDVWVIE